MHDRIARNRSASAYAARSARHAPVAADRVAIFTNSSKPAGMGKFAAASLRWLPRSGEQRTTQPEFMHAQQAASGEVDVTSLGYTSDCRIAQNKLTGA